MLFFFIGQIFISLILRLLLKFNIFVSDENLALEAIFYLSNILLIWDKDWSVLYRILISIPLTLLNHDSVYLAELPSGYPALAYTPIGTSLKVWWNLLAACEGYVKAIVFKREDGTEFQVGPPDNSFTLASCSDMLAQFQKAVKIENDPSPLTYSTLFSLGETCVRKICYIRDE